MDRVTAPEELPEHIAIEPARLQRLVTLLDERAAILRPDAALLEQALRRCPTQDSQSEDDFRLITAEPPRPEETPSEARFSWRLERVTTEDSASSETVLDVRGAAARRAVTNDAPVDPALAAAITSPETPGSIEVGKLRLRRRRARGIEPGTIIQGYQIHEMIGAGGMGQVYRATQLSLHRDVAFKVLSPRYADNAAFRKRFLREARSAGRFHHKNLISVHDVDEYDGLLFFSMDYVEGESLGERIGTSGQRLPIARALEIVHEVLEALEYAHARGVIHRDIKPDNIMLTTGGAVKLADLGLSRIDDPDVEQSHVTNAGIMMGTPFYMAPEQSEDAHSVDARSDLYSLGATLYHMVCGEVPFKGDSPISVVVNASTQPLLWPKVKPPRPVRCLIRRLMARSPADRPADAAQALRELAHCRRLLQPGLGWHRPLVRLLLLLLLLLVLGTLLVLGALRWNKHRQEAALTREVAALMDDQAYRQARQRLVDAGQAALLDHAHLTALDVEVVQAWDAWAQQQDPVATFFEEIEDLLVARRYAAAIARMSAFDDPVLVSPAVRARLAAKRLEALRLQEQAAAIESSSQTGAETRASTADGDFAVTFRQGKGAIELLEPGRFCYTGQNVLTEALPSHVQDFLRARPWRLRIDAGSQARWGLVFIEPDGTKRLFVGIDSGQYVVREEGQVGQRRRRLLERMPISGGQVLLHIAERTVSIRQRLRSQSGSIDTDLPIHLLWHIPEGEQVVVDYGSE